MWLERHGKARGIRTRGNRSVLWVAVYSDVARQVDDLEQMWALS